MKALQLPPSEGTKLNQPSSPRAPACGAVEFAIISSRSEFDALAGEWTALFERAGQGRHLFQSHNWLWHWANAFLEAEEASGSRLAIVTGRRDDNLALVWPLMLKISGPIRKLVWMGAPVSAYGDILVDDIPGADHLLAESLKFIRANSNADLLDLNNVVLDANISAPHLRDRWEKQARGHARLLDATFLASCRDVPALSSHRSRRMITRKRARFEQAGGGERVCIKSGEEAAVLTRRALHQKHMSVLGSLEAPEATDALETNERIECFYANVAAAREKPVGCEVSALTLDGNPAAIVLGFRTKSDFFPHVISFAPDARKYSVASLLLADLVSNICLKERVSLDHFTRDTPFTARWSNASTPVFDLAKPLSAVGEVYVRLRGGVIHKVARRTYQAVSREAYLST